MQVLVLHSPTDLSHTLNCLSSARVEAVAPNCCLGLFESASEVEFVDFNLSHVSLLFFAISEGDKGLQFCFSSLSVLLCLSPRGTCRNLYFLAMGTGLR